MKKVKKKPGGSPSSPLCTCMITNLIAVHPDIIQTAEVFQAVQNGDSVSCQVEDGKFGVGLQTGDLGNTVV